MSRYRRSYVPGGRFFLTLVTYRRVPLFSEPPVERGRYRIDWGCCCGGNLPQVPDFHSLEDKVGE